MSTQPAQVRIATIADRPEVFRLLLQAHHENGMFPFDMAKANYWINRFLQPELIYPTDTNTRGAIGVIGGDYLEAICIVVFGSMWYSSCKFLEEWTVYVEPSFRTSGHAKALVNWMKQQSTMLGLPLLTGVMSNHRTEAKVRLYERMLPRFGAYFLFNPATANSSSIAVH